MKRTAKAAVFTGVDQPFDIREYDVEPTPAGMATLDLIASGVCGTDLHIHRGKIPLPAPAIIGHEFVGRVAEIAEADAQRYGIRPGDAAIVDIACPCGQCPLCQAGDDANCLNMGVTNAGDPGQAPHFFGGYGEVNVSPVANLVRIPEGLDPEMVCAYACAGPTTIHAFRLAERANCRPEAWRTAVVQGIGPVGTFALLYLAKLGVKNVVAVASRRVESRDRLVRELGATETLYLNELGAEGVIERVRRLSDGIGADLALEASGNPRAFPQGLRMLRNRGLYLVPGQYSNSGGVPVEPQLITFQALQIIGSSQYAMQDVRDYLDFLLKHPEVHGLIASLLARYAVADTNQAFQDAKAGRNIKTILIK